MFDETEAGTGRGSEERVCSARAAQRVAGQVGTASDRAGRSRLATPRGANAVNSLVHHDQLVRSLRSSMYHGGNNMAAIPGTVSRIIEGDMWRERISQTGQMITFDSFAAFITTEPEAGLGTDERTLKNLCRDDIEASDLIDRALQVQRGGQADNQNASKSETNVDNVNVRSRPQGNSRNAALRRLRKDAPELHARVLAGDLSAHAAICSRLGFGRSLRHWRGSGGTGQTRPRKSRNNSFRARACSGRGARGDCGDAGQRVEGVFQLRPVGRVGA